MQLAIACQDSSSLPSIIRARHRLTVTLIAWHAAETLIATPAGHVACTTEPSLVRIVATRGIAPGTHGRPGHR
jgi:hypothetical protein